jgi:tetratricopeptide (TPR) repeat protein
MKKWKYAVVIALAAVVYTSGARAHEQSPTTGTTPQEKLGTVHFATSCTPETQQQFDRAIGLLHSFFFPETVKAFTAVAEKDPQCAIAYWGIAMSTRPNPLVPPFDAATLKKGLEAVQKGKAIGAKTQRERDYLAAIELFYKDYEVLDQGTRVRAYEKAMEQVYLRYPEDSEAAAFYALSLNESASPEDKTYANQLKAAAILEKVRTAQPDHPGVTHYLIHSYDCAKLASLGQSTADVYAKIAPSSPHAQHMPSHIYSMLGLWEDSIRSNQAALVVAREYASRNWPGASDAQQLHAMDFMEYAYLQEAKDSSAKKVINDLNDINKVAFVRLVGDTAYAAIPARYVLERGAWNEASELKMHPTQYPQAEAITLFTRSLGAARTGDLDSAKRGIEQLRSIQSSLNQSGQAYWAGQTEGQIRTVSAWVALAEGRNNEALRAMRSAADLEDSSEKTVAMENRLIPMRELLGYMLLGLKEYGQALKEFEASLQATPNRLRGYYGAGKAAELSGDRQKAKGYYERIVTLTSEAETERREIREAKAFLAAKSRNTPSTDSAKAGDGFGY